MIYLVDTNVLLRLSHTTDPDYPIARSSVDKLWANNNELKATSQNFAEFWTASTRATDKNGYGLTTSEANQLLKAAEQVFPLLPDSDAIYQEWRRLVVDYSVSGLQAFDARLVATMLSHNVSHILTFNTKHFMDYKPEGIVVVNPGEV